jgi:hypothetical protein
VVFGGVDAEIHQRQTTSGKRGSAWVPLAGWLGKRMGNPGMETIHNCLRLCGGAALRGA